MIDDRRGTARKDLSGAPVERARPDVNPDVDDELRQLRERLQVTAFERQNLGDALARLEEQRSRAEAELQGMRARQGDLQRETAALEAELHAMRERVRALERHVEEFLASHSWRVGRAVTFPWRRIKTLLDGRR